MGKRRAEQGGIFCNQAIKVYFGLDSILSNTEHIACLQSSCADSLMYVHKKTVGYDKCKFNSTLEAVLMTESKSITGEGLHAC